jgi:hypothetical protein
MPDSRTRTRLLVSVRNAQEARLALAAGVEWIDLKEPRAGPLGAASVEVAREVAAVVAGRAACSAALGELVDWPKPAQALLEVPGMAVVKLGLAGCENRADWSSCWLAASDNCASHGKQLAAVIYADYRSAEAPVPEMVLELAHARDCRYLLIDTFEKGSGTVLDALSVGRLGQLFKEAKRAGITTVLAGGLCSAVRQEALLYRSDLLAVRGAVCRGDRGGDLSAELLHAWVVELARHEACL